MHPLPLLKQAALEALDTKDGPGGMVSFFSLIDPRPVLELVEIAKIRITDEEVETLHQCMRVGRFLSAGGEATGGDGAPIPGETYHRRYEPVNF